MDEAFIGRINRYRSETIRRYPVLMMVVSLISTSSFAPRNELSEAIDTARDTYLRDTTACDCSLKMAFIGVNILSKFFEVESHFKE